MDLVTITTLDDLFNIIRNLIHDGHKLENLAPILQKYSGTDWKDFASFDNQKYKRNLVKKDDCVELLIICWDTWQGCGPHDHPENGCLMKILSGKINETIYDNASKVIKQDEFVRNSGDITYKEKDIIIHSIYNKYSEKAITLHLYSPPNYKPNFYKRIS